MKKIANRMSSYMKKVLPRLQVFLSAILAELTQNLNAAVQAIGFCPVFFVAHFRMAFQECKGSFPIK
jgi:hypothetical protein